MEKISCSIVINSFKILIKYCPLILPCKANLFETYFVNETSVFENVALLNNGQFIKFSLILSFILSKVLSVSILYLVVMTSTRIRCENIFSITQVFFTFLCIFISLDGFSHTQMFLYTLAGYFCV